MNEYVEDDKKRFFRRVPMENDKERTGPVPSSANCNFKINYRQKKNSV